MSSRNRLVEIAYINQPFPKLSRQQVAAIIARHKLDVAPDEASPLPRIGTVNTALALGKRYVLRVPKPHGIRETFTESVAAPAAWAAGVRTPKLLVFDNSRDIVDAPYTVYERVDGENFGSRNIDADENAGVFREIGRQLAILHQGVTSCPDPHGYLDRPSRRDPAELIAQLSSAALLGAYNTQWLDRVFQRLRASVDEAHRFRRFLHNDALPTNVIVNHSGSFAALIDWNNSGWGDPALEFWSMPSRAVPIALAGYREIAAMDGDSTVEQRILWDHLCHALELLQRPIHAENPSWARPPFSRMIELVAAASQFGPWQKFLA